MKTTRFIIVLLLACAAVVFAQKVDVTFDKKQDFAKLKTYTWTTNSRAADPDADKYIVEAIDRQLAASGLAKADAATADVRVAYGAVTRTDIDFDKAFSDEPSKTGSTGAHTYPVGTLIVAIRDRSDKVIWRGSIQRALPGDGDKAKAKQVVEDAVATLFAKYPTRAKS